MIDLTKPVPCGKCGTLDCELHVYTGLYGPALDTGWADRGMPFRARSKQDYWEDMALRDAFLHVAKKEVPRA